MLSGLHEIFVLLVIIFCVLLLPRFFGNKNRDVMLKIPNLSQLILIRKLRIFIIGSVIWPTSFALYMKPWENSLTSYLAIGIGPVFLFWSFCWIKAATK